MGHSINVTDEFYSLHVHVLRESLGLSISQASDFAHMRNGLNMKALGPIHQKKHYQSFFVSTIYAES